MKNLKKLSRQELTKVNGAAKTCIQNCQKGYWRCCKAGSPLIYQCLPVGDGGASGGGNPPGDGGGGVTGTGSPTC
jgi:hypothetical protein